MIIKSEKEKIRLDQFLADVLTFSRSKIQRLIKESLITVNDQSVSPSYLVKLEDEIFVIDNITFDMPLEKENIPLDIIYEDDDFLVVNKPSGMVVHPAPGNYNHTLVNALLYHFSLSSGSSVFRPGIVHRLDKDTSGLLLVAKNDEIHDKLSDMIAKKEVVRKYYALVEGVIPHETGTIDAPIGRDTYNRQRMMVTNVNAKNAITHFRVLKRYDAYTFIECQLETGRTHQIRVHLAYIGYPVANDPVYGRHHKTSDFGQLLHAHRLELHHPRTGASLTFESPLPLAFEEKVEELTNS